MKIFPHPRTLFLSLVVLTTLFLTACTTSTQPTATPNTPVPTASPTETTFPTAAPTTLPIAPTALPIAAAAQNDCPITQPQWLKPPVDAAVPDEPQYGNYITNSDQSILVGAWWLGQSEPYLVTNQWLKVGWFRPAGATLEIGGDPLILADPNADTTFRTEIPDGYPTRFTPTSLMFSTPGCWQITATAADKAITFVVQVDP